MEIAFEAAEVVSVRRMLGTNGGGKEVSTMLSHINRETNTDTHNLDTFGTVGTAASQESETF
jgi:hypothetical protein